MPDIPTAGAPFREFVVRERAGRDGEDGLPFERRIEQLENVSLAGAGGRLHDHVLPALQGAHGFLLPKIGDDQVDLEPLQHRGTSRALRRASTSGPARPLSRLRRARTTKARRAYDQDETRRLGLVFPPPFGKIRKPVSKSTSSAPIKVPTGVPGLDDILKGGLPHRRLYLLQGAPGAGKTTLALQFLLTGARAGEKVLYISLSETREEVEEVAASHDWSLDGVEIVELVGD